MCNINVFAYRKSFYVVRRVQFFHEGRAALRALISSAIMTIFVS